MSDGREYHQQMAQLQKALRERELHRLDLEKENLAKIQRREKRHEQLRSKIKLLHKELVQEEIESTQRVALLWSQVDSVRREYELLEARTERLRQKKRQYELFLSNANPGPLFYGTSNYGGPRLFKRPGQDAISLKPPSNTSHVLRSSVPFIQQQYQHPYVPYSVSPAQTSGTSVPVHVASHIAQRFESPVTGTFIPTLEHSERAVDSSEYHKLLNFRPPHGNNSETLSGGQDQRIFSAGNKIESAATLDSRVAGSHRGFINPDLDLQVTERMPEKQQILKNTSHSSKDVREISSDDHVTSSEKSLPKHPPQPSVLLGHPPQSFTPSEPHLQASSGHPQQSFIPPEHQPQSFLPPGYHPQFSTSPGHPPQSSTPPGYHPQFSTSLGHPPQSSTPPEYLQSSTSPGHPPQSSTPPGYHPQFSTSPGYPLQSSTAPGYHPQSPTSSGHYPQSSTSPGYRPQSSMPSGYPAQLSTSPEHPQQSFTPPRHPPQSPTSLGYPPQSSTPPRHPPQSSTPPRHPLQSSTPPRHPPQSSTSPRYPPQQSVLLDEDSDQTSNLFEVATTEDCHPPASEVPSSARTVEVSRVPVTEREMSAPIRGGNSRRVSEATSDVSLKENSIGSANTGYGEARDDYAIRRNQSVSRRDSVIGQSLVDPNAQRPSVARAGNPESGLDRMEETTPKHSLAEVKGSAGIEDCEYYQTSNEKSDSNETIPLPSGHSNPSKSYVSKPSEEADEIDDSDFFNGDVAPLTASRAYKSLLGDMAVGGPAIATETDSDDDIEGQMSSLAVRETSMKRPPYRPFTSSIPSLRPAPPGTDSDSVDSVEAAIQAAMNKPKQEQSEAPEKTPDEGQEGTTTASAAKPSRETVKEVAVKAGGSNTTKRTKNSAALSLKLESDSESYGVSAGGDVSEDDFDFYD